jgi:hypothetical protein
MFLLGQPKIDGLGQFHVGKTTLSQMPSLIDTNAGKLIYDKNENQYKSGGYEIAAVYFQYDLVLSFFHDTLFEISSNPRIELTELLDLKYGKPQPEHYSNVVVCRTGLKIDYTEIAHSFISKYRWDPVITAFYIIGSYYDDHCKLQVTGIFRITHKRLKKEWEFDTEKKLMQKEKNEEKEMKKDKKDQLDKI